MAASGAGAAQRSAESRAAGDVLANAALGSGRERLHPSTFGAMFCEFVSYFRSSVEALEDLERKLENLGHDVGTRYIELVWLRERPERRETNVTKMLQFISGTVWRSLFDKAADGLQASTDHENQYMLYDNDPLTNRFISVPSDYGSLSCASFLAGVIRGMLCTMQFVRMQLLEAPFTSSTSFFAQPCAVSAHTVDGGTHISGQRTVFLIKFEETVMDRTKMQAMLHS